MNPKYDTSPTGSEKPQTRRFLRGMCLLRRKRAAQPSMVSFKAGMGAVLPSRAMASVRL